MKVAVLAVQGAFIEHEQVLNKLGIESFEIRCKEDALKEFDGLILPGGESTVQGKLIKELGIFEILKEKIVNGMPTLATCAGMILLAEKLDNDEHVYFGTMPITVKRNAYGRQLGSFYCENDFKELGKLPMTFIRAPYVTKCSNDVEVMSVYDDKIVACKYKNQIALAFHPELDKDLSIHRYFINMIK